MNALESDTGRLPLAVSRKAKRDIDDESLDRFDSALKAFNVTLELAGVDNEIIAAELAIDTAQLNRCKSGKNNFPLNKLNDLLDACGNEVLLRWWARSRGYGLVRLKSHLEAEIEQKDRELEEMRLKIKHFEEFQKLGRSA